MNDFVLSPFFKIYFIQSLNDPIILVFLFIYSFIQHTHRLSIFYAQDILCDNCLRKSFDLFLTPVVYKLIGEIITECSRVQYRMIKKTFLSQTLKNQFPNYFSLDSLIKRTLTPLAWLG